MAAKETDSNRCWPGYEPVPGKEPQSEGSCRAKPDSKSSPTEKDFKAKRRKQLDQWQAEHPGAPRQAAQHLHTPGPEAGKPARKKAAAKTKRASKTK